MIAFLIFITLKADKADEFLRIAEDDARQSALEPGCLRFELYRQEDDPLRLVVMEMYRDQAALDAHRAMPYVDAWRQGVKDCTDAYSRVFLTPVAPAADAYTGGA